MLEHLNQSPVAPKRVVVIGARGFVGKAIVDRLRAASVDVVGLIRADVDLLAPNGSQRLASHLRVDDSVVAVSAIAPCKNPEMLRDNIVLATTMIRAFASVPLAHVVNISSDAVFGDEPLPLSETAPRAPESYHGVMHLAREIMFATEAKVPLAILRPTLIYGADDPHNGYGPNQFRRKANKGESITLFGEGEERRDHVAVEDVAELVARVLMHCSTGSLNVATGTVTSFRDLAEVAVKLSGKSVAVSGSPRKGPMPHNGYRPFNPAATSAAFPDFKYIAVADGMARAQKAEFANG
jgi:UDP-glucose 4-epimerase